MIEITEQMKEDIVKKAATLIAKASAPKALLTIDDISKICGLASRGSTMQNMLAAKDFPRPIMIGTREKRWYSGEVFRWIASRQI